MSKAFKTAIKQMDNAVTNLTMMYADHAEYPDERSREMARRAARVLLQLKNALTCGRAYSVASAAQEFDHVLHSEG